MEKESPMNWVEAKLGVVSEITSGYGFPLKYQGFTDYEIPFYKVGDISDSFKKGDVFLSQANNYINEDILKSIKAKKLSTKSIVFAKIGEAIRLNRRAITSEFCVIDNNVMALTFNKNIHFKYGYYFFQTVKLIDLSAGNAVPSIRKSVVENLDFPLPPLSEQNRIVEKLDRLFEQLELIKSSMEKIPVLLKNFRQQVLMHAVTGKLTEEWREGKELEEWRTDIIKNIATKMGSGSTPRGGSNSYISEGIPLVRSMNVVFGGIKLNGLAFINEDQAKALKNVEIFFEDVLLNITGASIGRLCLADKNVTGGRINQHVFIIRSKREIVLPKYLETYLSSNLIQKIIDEIKYGAGMEAISKTQIENMEINLPPLKEQHEIVSRVESLFVKADTIEEKYKSLKAKIEALPQTILHKAFKGEMSKQLESDGDAKDLLEEIMELKMKRK